MIADRDSDRQLDQFKRLKKRKQRKRKIRKSSKATTKDLYRYPRHTDIEVVMDTNNPKRVLLIPFPDEETLSTKIAEMLIEKFAGRDIDRELLTEMTIASRKMFCELRGINVAIKSKDEEGIEETEEDPSKAAADLEFYLSGN